MALWRLASLSSRAVRHKKRQIQTIAQWIQAFTIYTAALVSAHHSATLELLAYSLTTIKASQQYDGLLWRSYDMNYRVAGAASGNRRWSRLDTDLFTRFFTGRARLFNPCSVCDSVSHGAADCPMAPSSTASKRQNRRFSYATVQEAEATPQDVGLGHLR